MNQDADEKSAAAKRWLEMMMAKRQSGAGDSAPVREVRDGGLVNAITLWELEVTSTRGGRALCVFGVPAHLADKDGNWGAGAMSIVIDLVSAAAILSTGGGLKVTAEMEISYFSPAKIGEKVEVDGKVLGHKGKLSAVMVELKKKGSGELVALGKVWMAPGRPLLVNRNNDSKL